MARVVHPGADLAGFAGARLSQARGVRTAIPTALSLSAGGFTTEIAEAVF